MLIKAQETITAVNELKVNKPVSGELISAHIKYFISGTFPRAWSTSIIIPVHKKGCTNNPDNYRGIALVDLLSKIYISILNKRLTFYTQVYITICESQAGFRAGHSTVDNAFVLYSVIIDYQ